MALTIDYTDASDTAHVAAYWRLVELIFAQFGADQRVQIMLRAYSSRNAARNGKQHFGELRFWATYDALQAAAGSNLIAKVYVLAAARVPTGDDVDLRTAQDALE